jgi:hypothetical protein
MQLPKEKRQKDSTLFTYKWKVHNRKIEIISFLVSFVLNRPSLAISRCRSRYETLVYAKT